MDPGTATTTLVGISPPQVKGGDVDVLVLVEGGERCRIRAGKSIWRGLMKYLWEAGITIPTAEKPSHGTSAPGETTAPSIGRIVGFVLPAGHKRQGEIVPAIITRIHPNDGGQHSTHVQLTPFVDAANDAPVPINACSLVPFSARPTPCTWHWLARQP